MNPEDVKVGQRVKLTGQAGKLFYTFNRGREGVVTRVEDGGDYIHVLFDDDGGTDFGSAGGLILLQDVAQPAAVPANVRDAIAEVERTLAALKALVG